MVLEGIKAAFRRKEKNEYFISFRELWKATNKFDEKNVIGIGGFGKVYLGTLKSGTKVAVKRRKKHSYQGEREFQVETGLVPSLSHPNVVSLFGYCDTNDEMILVYEYMKEGTLKSHLYGSDRLSPVSWDWEQRLLVSVGAAKGLNYLHTRSPNGIIHRDIKSDNILLDENLCAKIGDFGLLRTGPEMNQTHVITRAMGTPGYVDLEYWRTQQLTVKSDVFSFGAVLLEVLCGRPVIDNRLPAEKANLVCWGQKMLEEGKVEQIVDEKIIGTIHPHNLTMFGNVVLKCLAEERAERPTMEEVLKDLEWELECVRATASANSSTEPAAEDESDDDVSSQPIISQGQGRALKRSEGKIYKRTPDFDHH
ncbi:receptor-like protein kinase THESEUS 1 [Panicum hallii]|jgi:serine/threonine protein kinase|uniref:receptor-like protein kinase THESEUS 1 n=1 Tax=Panicum hallii TaxID=206008 RepID=UPI000DF4CAC6|nr:receptor-like protein kinase THESEUS 1 [Panicum hallii]